MLNRRTLMKHAGATAVAAVSSGSVQAASAGNACGPSHAPSSDAAERLLYELASMEARYYSEEGVAMVLSCENLVATDDVPREPDASNSRFAAAFRHYAGLLSELRADLTAADVASVVELIAKRDFDSGGASFDE